MKYKFVFLDLDGTLLSRSEKISNATRESLLRAQRRGITAVINSGRTAFDIERILNKNRLQMSYIALNGAYMYDVFSRTVVYRKGFDSKMCTAISNVSRQLSVPGLWCTEKRTFSQSLQSVFSVGSNFIIPMARERRDEKKHPQFLKYSVFCSDAERMSLVRKKFESLAMLEISASAPTLLELNAKGVTKGTGMLRFLDHCGYVPEEAVAIGDYENDISMIRTAGLGVAMGNAIAVVKEAADFVTDTNTRNGVGKLLDSLPNNGDSFVL